MHENAVKRIKQNGTHYPVNICIIQCLRSKYKYSYVITKLYIGKRVLKYICLKKFGLATIMPAATYNGNKRLICRRTGLKSGRHCGSIKTGCK